MRSGRATALIIHLSLAIVINPQHQQNRLLSNTSFFFFFFTLFSLTPWRKGILITQIGLSIFTDSFRYERRFSPSSGGINAGTWEIHKNKYQKIKKENIKKKIVQGSRSPHWAEKAHHLRRRYIDTTCKYIKNISICTKYQYI